MEAARGDVQFECLRCGKVSRVERVRGIQPRCSTCGSHTGVLGDIGHGTVEDRLRRLSAAQSDTGNVTFECLRCGTVTQVVRLEIVSPGCAHCGSGDGVVLEAPDPASPVPGRQ